MQLTDSEIREIILRERIRKKKRMRRRRRLTLFAVIIIGVSLFGIISVYKEELGLVPPRGIIFLDPGHGGGDPGSFVGERYEKNDTLRLALEVKDRLRRAGFKVYMSRTDDSDVDRTRRGEMANECGAQLMVSIHRNKAEGGDGVEVFIPSSDAPESRLLGNNILKALVGCGFSERTVRAGTLTSDAEDYEETGAATMPCCLVEVGFISNDGDNALFDDGFDQNAQAISDAIESTFHELYEPEEEEETEEGGSDEDL